MLIHRFLQVRLPLSRRSQDVSFLEYTVHQTFLEVLALIFIRWRDWDLERHLQFEAARRKSCDFDELAEMGYWAKIRERNVNVRIGQQHGSA